ISTRPSIDTEPSPPPDMSDDFDTTVVGGDFDMLDTPSQRASIAEVAPTHLTDPEAVESYRKAPTGGPAPLRAAERSGPPVALIIAIGLPIIVALVLVFALSGGDKDEDNKAGDEPEAGETEGTNEEAT